MITPALYRFSFLTPQGKTEVSCYDTVRLPEPGKNGSFNTLYVCDEHTFPLLQQAVNYDPSVPCTVLPAGDSAKTLDAVEKIVKTAAEHGLDRQAVFIGFGGGTVCDITALAASLYMRGVSCILIPTTVLAMADAAIGGKTAVNFAGYKNLIGSFYLASSVMLCFPVLTGLPEREYRSGLAEIVKTALLYDPELYRMFFSCYNEIIGRKLSRISVMIQRAAEAKARVAERDFTEQGERTFLNLGHSFAHALESLSGFSVPHGDAVAWGMSRAAATGLRLGISRQSYADRLMSLLSRYGWCIDPVYSSAYFSPGAPHRPVAEDYFAEAIIAVMKKDKKNRGGAIRLVLQEDVQKTQVCEVTISILQEVLQ
ncbi:MAG: 3-dehydroquinate synthase [Treponema sp.]